MKSASRKLRPNGPRNQRSESMPLTVANCRLSMDQRPLESFGHLLGNDAIPIYVLGPHRTNPSSFIRSTNPDLYRIRE